MSNVDDPLRQLGDWRPQFILRRFGPAVRPDEQLARLFVALAVLHGPAKVKDLILRVEIELRRTAPRLEMIASDPSLANARPLLKDLIARASPAIAEIPKLKARALNETKPNPSVGLTLKDLGVLVDLVRATVFGHEITARPSPAGVERTRQTFGGPPTLGVTKIWLKRLLPGLPAASAHLTDAPALGRVVVVHEDGRLAYDPAGAPS